MVFRLLFTVVLLVICTHDTAHAEEKRNWVTDIGAEIEAEFNSIIEDKVILLFKGERVVIPINRLSPGDQTYIADRLKQVTPARAATNSVQITAREELNATDRDLLVSLIEKDSDMEPNQEQIVELIGRSFPQVGIQGEAVIWKHAGGRPVSNGIISYDVQMVDFLSGKKSVVVELRITSSETYLRRKETFENLDIPEIKDPVTGQPLMMQTEKLSGIPIKRGQNSDDYDGARFHLAQVELGVFISDPGYQADQNDFDRFLRKFDLRGLQDISE